ncbi:MAG: sensory histidine kinase CreC [Methanomassiliicoccales archaeon PtaU1.Bin124]|nr:MAG: sensory histidine kinase CreC [Methanomassiliicoccales archaeon PtaU1.Bin124]
MLVQSTVVDMSIIDLADAPEWARRKKVARRPIQAVGRSQRTLDHFVDGEDYRPASLPSVEEELEYQRTMRQMLRHDLQNKLTVAQGGLELFERERQDRFLEMAKRNLDACGEIVAKMSSLEKSLAPIELMPVDVVAMAERVFRCHEGRGVDLRIEGDGLAMADGTLFHVIENLVSNALRHADPSCVTVSVEEKGQKVLLKVIDDGNGIPLEAREQLFHEGFKFGPKANTGLGLYIVSRIVQRYHGRIWFEDNLPHGTIFNIELRSGKAFDLPECL